MKLFSKNTTFNQEKEKLKALHGIKKLQYILDYYKLPIVLLCIFLYIIGYLIYGHVTRKEPILYTALVNVTTGDTLTKQLGNEFLTYLKGENVPAGSECHLYTNLYLTDDENSEYHEYTSASRLKILSAIDAEKMDVILMNKEAFDAFSQNGYLCNLEEFLSQKAPDLYEKLKPQLVNNTVILEDNAKEMLLDPSVKYSAVTDEYPMGLDLSQFPLFWEAGFSDKIYFGVIANSPRGDMAIRYLKYLNTK